MNIVMLILKHWSPRHKFGTILFFNQIKYIPLPMEILKYNCIF